jgi:hypothetical protein
VTLTEEDSGPHRHVERTSNMNPSRHLGERRFEQRPRCLDAEIAVAPSPVLARGLWTLALILAAIGVAALIALR